MVCRTPSRRIAPERRCLTAAMRHPRTLAQPPYVSKSDDDEGYSAQRRRQPAIAQQAKGPAATSARRTSTQKACPFRLAPQPATSRRATAPVWKCRLDSAERCHRRDVVRCGTGLRSANICRVPGAQATGTLELQWQPCTCVQGCGTASRRIMTGWRIGPTMTVRRPQRGFSRQTPSSGLDLTRPQRMHPRAIHETPRRTCRRVPSRHASRGAGRGPRDWAARSPCPAYNSRPDSG